MQYHIRFTAKAEKQLRDLSKAAQAKVARWIDRLAEDPTTPRSKQLQGHPQLRRVHAGKDYVIVYSIVKHELVVLVVAVDHRRNVYRDL